MMDGNWDMGLGLVSECLLKRLESPAEAGSGYLGELFTPRLKPGAKTGRLKPAIKPLDALERLIPATDPNVAVGRLTPAIESHFSAGRLKPAIDANVAVCWLKRAIEPHGALERLKRAIDAHLALYRLKLAIYFTRSADQVFRVCARVSANNVSYDRANRTNDLCYPVNFPALAGSLFAPGFSRGGYCCKEKNHSRLQPGFPAASAFSLNGMK